MVEPLSVACPFCGALRGEYCHVQSPDGTCYDVEYPHAARVEWAARWAAWHGDRPANREVPPL